MDANWLKSMRIGVALRALRELIHNPEDTPRVFEIVRALGRPALKRGLRRFRTTEVGQRVLRDRVDLIDTLRDRESLAAKPAGTLGRTYYDFIYGESLSADGLVAASMEQGVEAYNFKNPDLKRFGERMRDQHDLWHTVTQYGRDPFGELCLLAFSYAQLKNRGIGYDRRRGRVSCTAAVGTRFAQGGVACLPGGAARQLAAGRRLGRQPTLARRRSSPPVGDQAASGVPAVLATVQAAAA